MCKINHIQLSTINFQTREADTDSSVIALSKSSQVQFLSCGVLIYWQVATGLYLTNIDSERSLHGTLKHLYSK